ncbi:CbiX/SirB N-terminal domain-containing protein [Rubinisphaera sp.]|uniref:sirohydrochlorin chelatase n=1 Tax=Rubinisphaera sp. TaxID=2024857 RepID=UPI000C0E28C6|nr:CbiX/SirB N-terminal domain-containing protein [Rubinisphaera sp.]MBV10389.1 cobalamin biosynthesis protein CbiX [Rubinisphaera sp.]HCS53041.1 cobalamin biosynthesis protein CbiX [Planctomycetaceae bacterium]|tara:strand:- start:4601 stop:4981 length:381 start_codon:yes stop_codon:yes gene_type:complete
MNTPQNETAILLIAHGSRRQQANDDLFKLADMVRKARPDSVIESSFLELTEPTIPQGAEKCVASGATRVLMFPYFLSAGTHVVDDLEEFRHNFAEKWPNVEFKVCPHLGLHPLMVEIVFDRIAAAE